jgi:hypothetical protein
LALKKLICSCVNIYLLLEYLDCNVCSARMPNHIDKETGDMEIRMRDEG